MHFLSYPSSLSNFVRVHAVCRGGFQPGSFRFFRLGLLPPPPPPRIEHHESRPPRHYFPLSLSLLLRRPLEGCRWPLAMKTRLPVRRPRSVRGSGLAGGGQKWHLRAREISWTASARGLPPSEVTRQSQTIVVHLAGGGAAYVQFRKQNLQDLGHVGQFYLPPSLPCSVARVVEGEDGKILAAILKVLFALLRSPHSRLRKEGG